MRELREMVGELREGKQLLSDLRLGLAYSRKEVPSALYLVYLIVLHPLYFNMFQILVPGALTNTF